MPDLGDTKKTSTRKSGAGPSGEEKTFSIPGDHLDSAESGKKESTGLLKKVMRAASGVISRDFVRDEAVESAKKESATASAEVARQIARATKSAKAAEDSARKASEDAARVTEKANQAIADVRESIEAGAAVTTALETQRKAEHSVRSALTQATEREVLLATERAAQEIASKGTDEALDDIEGAKSAQIVQAAKQAAEHTASEVAEKVARTAAAAAALTVARKAVTDGIPRDTAERLACESAERAAFVAAEKAASEQASTAAQAAAEGAALEVEKALSSKAAREAEEHRIREADRLARTARAQKAARVRKTGGPGTLSERTGDRISRRRERPPRRLNLPFAIGLVVFMVLIGGGVPLLHGIQINRTSSRSLERGLEAEEKGNLSEAIRLIGYYLRAKPDDYVIRGKLALLVAEKAKKNPNDQNLHFNAYRQLERAIVRLPDDLDIIRNLAEFSFTLGRYSSGIEHYQRLIKAFPKESDLQVQLGRCYVATEHTADAIRVFSGVNATDKKNIDAYVGLAELYRSPIVDDPEAADALMVVMVSENPGSYQAFLSRADYRLKYDQPGKAQEDLLSAVDISPNALEVLLTASRHAREQKNVEKAQEYVDNAWDLYPDHPKVKAELAIVSVLGGKITIAEGILNPDDGENKINDPSALIQLTDIHLKQGNLESAREDIRRMRKVGFRPEVIEYFDARIQLAENNWLAGTKLLERLRTNVAGWPEFRNQVDLLLGACYEKLRLIDRQLDTYQNIVADDPDNLPANMGYAAALFQTGKLDKSYEHYQKLIEQMGEDEFLAVPGLRNNLFQLIIARTEQLPELQREWTELEEYIDKLSEIEGVDSTQYTLMRAELLAKKGQFQMARDLIAVERDNHPKRATLWVALSKLVAMDEGPEEGLKILEESDKKEVTDKLVIQMTRANFASRLKMEKARPVLNQLAVDLDDLAEGQKARMWLGLGAAHYRLRDRAMAKKYWNLAANASPDNLRIRMTLFELAREAGQEKDMNAAADEIRRLNGLRSAEALYCDASIRVWNVKTGRKDKSLLANIDQDLAAARKLRPSWHEIPRLKGEIALLQENVDDAAQYFEEAAELGPLSPVYMSQLVRLLYVKGRYDKAHEVLSRIGGTDLSLTRRKLEAEVKFRIGRLSEAIELASETVKGSTVANDHLWYGQMLAQDGQFKEAEHEVRLALEIDSNIPEAWIGLVRLLAQQEKREEAKSEILLAQTRLPVDRTPLVLAECYAILGDTGRAEKHYLNAIRFDPENLSVIRRVARFYLQLGRSGQTESQKYLQQLLDKAGRDPNQHQEDLDWARRNLARVLATGDWRQLQEALHILDSIAEDGSVLIEDRRLKALLLGKRPEISSRKKAITLLETLRENPDAVLSPKEEYTLALLYENVGRWLSAQETLSRLVRENPDNATFLGNFVNLMLKNDAPISDIRPHLKKLLSLQPKDPWTISLNVRVLAKEGKDTEAVALAKTLVPRPLPDDLLMRLRNAAGLLEEIDQIDEAKKMLEEFGEKVPGGNVILGAFLGRHRSIDESLAAVSSAQDQVPVAALLPAALSILKDQNDKTEPTHFELVETWFDQAFDQNSNSKQLQLQWATFLSLREEYDRVIEIYQQFLKRDDLFDREKAIVWNNLAFYLAAGDEDPKKSLEYANQAIEILGPIPDLLDTRGIARLADNDFLKAIEDFRLAISGEPSGIMYFHRALAYKARGKFPDAIRSIELARKNHDLVEKDIPKIERQKYRDLLKALKLEPKVDTEKPTEEKKPISLPGLSD